MSEFVPARTVGSPPVTAPVSDLGAWCWFGDPRAVHVPDRARTFAGWITAAGEIVVAQHEHDTGATRRVVLMADFPVDDHNNPAICIRPDGHLLVFWTGHADRTVHKCMYYRRSAAPYDVAQWGPTMAIDANTEGSKSFTYDNPVQLSSEPGRLYLFWRGGDFNPTYAVTDDLRRWTAPAGLVHVAGERPYLKVHGNGVDRIDFAFTDGHPHRVHTGVFHMYYTGGNLYRTDGSLIGPMGAPTDELPAIPPEAASTVYSAVGAPKAWVHDIALDTDGHPVIVFATFPGEPEHTDHRYHYARWDGEKWQLHDLVAAGDTIYTYTPDAPPSERDYSGGISLDHADPSIVLLSRSGQDHAHRIERWQTPDAGASWTSTVLSAGTDKAVRPFRPVGMTGDGPLSVLWMQGPYSVYTEIATRIMALGPAGQPVPLSGD